MLIVSQPLLGAKCLGKKLDSSSGKPCKIISISERCMLFSLQLHRWKRISSVELKTRFTFCLNLDYMLSGTIPK